MEKERGFLESKEEKYIEVSYLDCKLVEAKELGNAILGVETCIKEAAKILKFNRFQVLAVVENFEHLKIKFKLAGIGTKKTSMLTALISESLEAIQTFGVNRVFNLKNDVVSNIGNPKVLALCNSRRFMENVQNMVAPLNSTASQLRFSFGSREVNLLSSKQNEFFETIKTKKILPEMKNGETVELTGEITRLNKEYNDIGLRIRNRILRCLLPDKDKEIAQFHDFIRESEVLLKGMIERRSLQETPKVKIISIEKIDTKEQMKLVF